MAGPSSKRARFSLEPDLEVVVEGQTILVLSYVLMAASPIFQRMLQSDMREGQTARIELPDKCKQDFCEVLQHLDTAGCKEPPAITRERVPMLLCWADEYQMEGLRNRIDRFLTENEDPDGIAQLKEAVDFNLASRREQCLQAVTQDIGKHVVALRDVIHDRATMQLLWPAVFEEAGLRPPSDAVFAHPGPLELWPFVAKALVSQPSGHWSQWNIEKPSVKVRIASIDLKCRVKCEMRPDHMLGRVMRKWCGKSGLSVEGTKFFFDGERVGPQQSPADLKWYPWLGVMLVTAMPKSAD